MSTVQPTVGQVGSIRSSSNSSRRRRRSIPDTGFGQRREAAQSHDTKTASFLSCFLNLTNVAIGVGTLSLPYSFSRVGWVLGLTLMTACTMCSSLGLQHLLRCADMTGAPGYTALAGMALGRWSVVVTYTFFVLIAGALAAYFTVITDYLDTIVATLCPSAPVYTASAILAVMVVALIYPLSLSKNMSRLAFTSTLSLLGILYVVVLVPASYFVDQSKPSFTPPPVEKAMWGWDVLSAWSTMAMAFINHSNVIEIASELKPVRLPLSSILPTKVVAWTDADGGRAILAALSSLFIALVYALVSISGYLHYGAMVAPNVLNSEPLSPFFTVARIAIVVCMVLSFPVLVYPCRVTLEQLLRQNSLMGWLRRRGDQQHVASTDSAVPADEHAPLLAEPKTITAASVVTVDGQTYGAVAIQVDPEDQLSVEDDIMSVMGSLSDIGEEEAVLKSVLVEHDYFAETAVPLKAVFIIALAYGLSVTLPGLNKILALTGAMSGSLVIYIFPALYYLNLTRAPSVHQRHRWLTVGAWLNIAVGSVLFLAGSFYALVDLRRQ